MARASRRTGSGASLFEGLESRQMLAAFPYEFKSYLDALGVKDVIYDFAQGSTDPQLSHGAAVAGLADINKDGFGDFAVAWPERARVDLFSGKDMSVIRTLERAEATAFGWALANVGDVNDDGVPDLAVGTPRFDADGGATVDRQGGVWVYSGADGSVLWTVAGSGASDELGHVVVGAGDLNGDDVPDVVVGAPGAGAIGAGRVFVYSGVDGAVVRTLEGEKAGDRFGQAVAVRDVPTSDKAADGAADIAVGAPGFDSTEPGASGHDHGKAYLYDGATWGLRESHVGGGEGDALGTAVALGRGGSTWWFLIGRAGLGDATSTIYYGAEAGGGILMYDVTGATGRVIQPGYIPHQAMGTSIQVLGAIRSKDRDLIAVTSEDPTYRIELMELDVASINSSLSYQFQRPAQIGSNVVAAGDINGDGYVDLLSGSVSAEGRVKVWSSVFTWVGGGGGQYPSYGYGGYGSYGYGSPGLTMAVNISGISDNARYAWSTADYAGTEIRSDDPEFGGFIIVDGKIMNARLIPGLGRAVIFGINNDGLIVGADLVTAYEGRDGLGARFLLKDGVKTYLRDAVKTVDSTVSPNLDTISFVKVGNNGEALLQSTTPTGYLSWLLVDGKLSLLWEGFVNDINDAGTVLGVRWKAGSLGTTVVRFASGATVDLPKFYDAKAINNKGQVGGSLNGELTIWENGQYRKVADNPTVYGTPVAVSWSVRDLDDRGRISANFNADYGYGPGWTAYLYTPRLGLKAAYDISVSYQSAGFDQLRDNGWMFSSNGVAVPTLVSELEENTPLASVDTPMGSVSVGITEDGQGYVSRAVKGGRLNQVLQTSPDGPTAGPRLTDIQVYVDPHDGHIYVVGLSDRAVHWWQITDEGYGNPATISTTSADNSIVKGLTVFTSRDGRVHIAGLNAKGEVVIYYQNGTASPDSPLNWSALNLSRDHLAAEDLETPKFVGGFTSFVTSWNGMNIVGLDEDGQLQTVWWAPGLTHWRVDNLSEIAGTPVLTGTVSGYVTPWGGLNVAGTDADGNVHIAWWAPGMKAWQSDALPDAKLTPGSISTYTTPWGGLNVAGVDKEGNVAVAWWTPDKTEWTVENLGGELGRFGDEAVGKVVVSGVCARNGVIELYCRQPVDEAQMPWIKDGRMVRMYLDPTLQRWMIDDVSSAGV